MNSDFQLHKSSLILQTLIQFKVQVRVIHKIKEIPKSFSQVYMYYQQSTQGMTRGPAKLIGNKNQKSSTWFGRYIFNVLLTFRSQSLEFELPCKLLILVSSWLLFLVKLSFLSALFKDFVERFIMQERLELRCLSKSSSSSFSGDKSGSWAYFSMETQIDDLSGEIFEPSNVEDNLLLGEIVYFQCLNLESKDQFLQRLSLALDYFTLKHAPMKYSLL